MKFLNSWKSHNKQWDKVNIHLRVGAIDFFMLKYDHSNKDFEFRVLNLGVKSSEG